MRDGFPEVLTADDFTDDLFDGVDMGPDPFGDKPEDTPIHPSDAELLAGFED